jgi:hypothetical protein
MSSRSCFRAMLSGYVIPPGFPSLLIDGKPIPLVYYSSGELRIRSDTVSYSARSYEETNTSKRHRNLNSQIGFTISRSNIQALGRFKPNSGGLSYFAINWLEIQSRDPQTSALLCVGGLGPGMRRLSRRTDILAQAIEVWTNGKWIEVKDTWSA